MDTEEGASMGSPSTLDGRSDPRSPMSAGRLNASTMSMRAKAKRKRQANAQHNSNFRAGYVPVDEDVLHRSGIRGRKRHFLYCIIGILVIVALLNALVTAWLVYLLGLTHNGMMSIELTDIGSRHFLRVLSKARIITMTFDEQSFLGSRYQKSLSLTASESKLRLRVSRESALQLEDGNFTVSTGNFSVYSKGKKTSINMETITGMASNLRVPEATMSEIKRHPHYQDLSLESVFNDVRLNGAHNVSLVSQKGIEINKNKVILQSKGKISIEGNQGVYVDPNFLKISSPRRQDSTLSTYKLCVCDTGRLFKVPVSGPGTSCDVGASLHDLCASS